MKPVISRRVPVKKTKNHLNPQKRYENEPKHHHLAVQPVVREKSYSNVNIVQ